MRVYFKKPKNGAPERIRTSDLLNRNQMLYPAELRVRLILVVFNLGHINSYYFQLAFKIARSQSALNY